MIRKIEDFISKTGYPFEQRVAHMLRENGWTVFSPVEYRIPPDQLRELDILCYKIINRRRVELRISCKQSIDKHWIFFTEKNNYLRFGSELKFTPVQQDIDLYRSIPYQLKDLLLFRYDRRVTNFTAFSAKKQDEARMLIKDGIYSALNSVYLTLYPLDLTVDQRGTIYFFVTLFNGLMFESYYEPECNQNKLNEIEYTQWRTEYQLDGKFKEILNFDGSYVPFNEIKYNFSEHFVVEIVQWNYFEQYLHHIEALFSSLDDTIINLFGKPYESEFFSEASLGKQVLR